MKARKRKNGELEQLEHSFQPDDIKLSLFYFNPPSIFVRSSCLRLDRRGSLQRQLSFTWESRLQDGKINKLQSWI